MSDRMESKKGWSIIFHLTQNTFEHMFQKGHIFVRVCGIEETSVLDGHKYTIPIFKCITCNYLREGDTSDPREIPTCDDHCIKSILT